MAETKCFEYIDHTADIGIRGFGETFLDALANVALGMFSIIHQMDQIELKETRIIEVTAASREDLVVQFLNQLLYLHDTAGFIPKEYQMELYDNSGIRGTIQGELFKPEKHTGFDEIKAVTYHQLQINQTDTGWVIQVICDI